MTPRLIAAAALAALPTLAHAAAAPPLPPAPQLAKWPNPPAVTTQGEWKKTTLVKPLENPWGLAFLPDGAILVTERPGRLRLVKDGKLVPEPITGTPQVAALGQGGLLDIALHPRFAENSLVYFTYATGTLEANRTCVGRGKLEGNEIKDFQEIFKATPDKPGNQHFGSNLLWLNDGTLLVSMGDGGNPPNMVDGILAKENAQKLDRHLGKVLRLDENGKAPKDNPFVGKDGALPEIYTWGNRNIQGMALDKASGRVWANEHGSLGGDELNLLQPGKNYGWPVVSYSRDYKTREAITPRVAAPEFTDPKVVWIPSKAPSGLCFYTGDAFPEWKGNLLSGALAHQMIKRVVLDGENPTGQESLPLARRVRCVVQGPDGLVYVLTDHKDGELLRIEPVK